MNFNRIQATEVKLWDFSAYFWKTPRMLTGIPWVIFICCFRRLVATGNTSCVQLNTRPVVKGKFLKPSNLKNKGKFTY